MSVLRKSASHGEAGYARRPRDTYFTEPWVTEALCRAVKFEGPIWEPACGDGRMSRALQSSGYTVLSTDIGDWGYGTPGVDFLMAGESRKFGAIITNPPFALAIRFIQRALLLTKPQGGQVAMLQRHEFDAPISHHPLFRPPFAAKLILPRRPRWVDDDKASPRFPYAWYLWDWRHEGPPTIRWLSSYDAAADAIGSYNEAIRAIGERVKAGEPIPPGGYFGGDL